MSNEAFAGLVDGSTSLDLLILFYLFADEVEEDVVLENGGIEG